MASSSSQDLALLFEQLDSNNPIIFFDSELKHRDKCMYLGNTALLVLIVGAPCIAVKFKCTSDSNDTYPTLCKNAQAYKQIVMTDREIATMLVKLLTQTRALLVVHDGVNDLKAIENSLGAPLPGGLLPPCNTQKVHQEFMRGYAGLHACSTDVSWSLSRCWKYVCNYFKDGQSTLRYDYVMISWLLDGLLRDLMCGKKVTELRSEDFRICTSHDPMDDVVVTCILCIVDALQYGMSMNHKITCCNMLMMASLDFRSRLSFEPAYSDMIPDLHAEDGSGKKTNLTLSDEVELLLEHLLSTKSVGEAEESVAYSVLMRIFAKAIDKNFLAMRRSHHASILQIIKDHETTPWFAVKTPRKNRH